MTATYEAIATTTLGSAQSEIEFGSISGTYTDLVLIYAHSQSGAGEQIGLRFNSDTGTNYSATVVYGEASAGSARTSNLSYVRTGHGAAATDFNMIVNIQNYSNSTTNKTVVARNNVPTSGVYATAGLWRSTNAITNVKIVAVGGTNNIPSGARATLYGIKAE